MDWLNVMRAAEGDVIECEAMKVWEWCLAHSGWKPFKNVLLNCTFSHERLFQNIQPLYKALELRGHVSSILFSEHLQFLFFFKNDTAKFFILEGLLSLFYSLICVSKLHNEPHNAKRQLAKMPL